MSSNQKRASQGRLRGAGRKALAVAASVVIAVTATLPAAMQEASALDNGLALTPPMGWNSWNQTRCTAGVNGGTGPTEAKVKAAADAMASNGMKEAGFEYVVVDDCYQGGRDGDGKLFSNPETFPSGMKALGDYIHAKGLKFGVYAVPGEETCANHWDDYPIYGLGSYGHEQTDAETFAEWGVDYLKYDWCRADVKPGNVDKIETFNKMRDELAKVDRDIVYAISEYGDDNPWEWGADTANQWRTTHDINSTWGSVAGIINGQANLWQYSGPGAWNDPDMLQVGNGDFKNNLDANRAHVGMWAMLAAPLMVGTSIPDMSDDLVATLTNPDIIAIDQDPLGKQAKRLSNNGGAQVWARPLQDGRIAVALYNSNGSGNDMNITTDVAAVGGSGTYTVRSVWEQKNVMNTSGALSATVPARGAVIYILTPGQDPSLPTAPELRGSVSIQADTTKDATFTVANVGDADITNVAVTFGTATGVTLPTDAQSVGTIAGKSSKDFTVSITATASAQGTITVPATITYGDGKSVTTSVTVTVPLADKAYISDLTWISSVGGYGPVERDKANGELPANDGPPIKLGGVTYPKGLGTNPAARVSVALGGQCTSFKAVIGMDDDVKDRAAAGGVKPKSTFEVYGDDEELYNFSFEQPTNEPRAITVDVTGVETLELRNGLVGAPPATGEDKRSWFAWADWADAHLVCGVTEPPSSPSAMPTVTVTATTTATATATATATTTATTTATATATTTATTTTTATETATATATATATNTVTATQTATVTATAQPTTGPTVKPTVKPTATSSAPVDAVTLYTTPGHHNVNGRQWYTTCEPYSQTIRCRTEIWSTSVAFTGGKFVKDTGWHFNNLTYLPKMTRAQWGTNPLANSGTFTSAGHQWRTECDTAATGRGACRSYIWTKKVLSTQLPNGTWKYALDEDWVFNNMVKFA